MRQGAAASAVKHRQKAKALDGSSTGEEPRRDCACPSAAPRFPVGESDR